MGQSLLCGFEQRDKCLLARANNHRLTSAVAFSSHTDGGRSKESKQTVGTGQHRTGRWRSERLRSPSLRPHRLHVEQFEFCDGDERWNCRLSGSRFLNGFHCCSRNITALPSLVRSDAFMRFWISLFHFSFLPFTSIKQ